MHSFQRARSQEQREQRRRAILDAAAAMLAEMRVADVTLNELSRRVGLAKSNVLRYFESREAVLLELCEVQTSAFLATLDDVLRDAIDTSATAEKRVNQLAAALANTLADHPVLCDLVSEQGAVLERNVSVEVATGFKRTSIEQLGAFAASINSYLPELPERDATRCITLAMLMAGAIWTHSHPSAALVAAYEANPDLAVFRLEFTSTLTDALETFFAGALARSG